MVKKLFILSVLIIINFVIKNPQPSIKIEVEYDYTIDGDTVFLIENGVRQKYRLLMVNTPETNEALGDKATDYTQNLLENGDIIEIEYQEDNELEDPYERKLVWVFVDGQLLQEKLCAQGLVESLYDNGGNYTYKSEVVQALNYAKEHKMGIYEK